MNGLSENDIVRVLDPRMDLNTGFKMKVDEGPRIVSFQNKPASSAGTSGLQFENINPGSTGFVVDRKMYINARFKVRIFPVGGADRVNRNQIVFNVNAGNAGNRRTQLATGLRTIINNIGIGITNGTRAFPLTSFTRSMDVVINGETFSYEVGRYWEVLNRYQQSVYDESAGDYSLTPSMPDSFYRYKTFGAPAGIPNTPGFEINPFISYGSNNSRTPRGSFLANEFDDFTIPEADLIITAGSNTVNFDGFSVNYSNSVDYNGGTGDTTFNYIELDLDVTEPLLIPILSESIGCDYDSRGLYGVNELRIALRFSNNVGSLYCGVSTGFDAPDGAGTDTIRDFNLELSSTDPVQANLFYQVLTPKILPELPLMNVYSDERIKLRAYKVVTPAVGETSIPEVNTNNISVGTIPSRVYIWLSTDIDNRLARQSQTFATIKKLSMQFNNQDVQYTNADPRQLYLMCKRNGLEVDWLQFSKFIGSPICIDFARDVSLNDGDYPGRIGNYNIDIRATWELLEPVFAATDVYNMYTLIVEKGYCYIMNQQASRVGGMQVDPNSIPITHMSGYDVKHVQDIYGGNIKDIVKKYAPKALNLAKKVVEHTPQAISFVEKALPYAAKGLKYASMIPLLAAGANVSENEARNIMKEYGNEKGVEVLRKMQKASGSKVGGRKVGGQGVGGRKSKSVKGGAKTSKTAMKKRMSIY